MVAKVTGSMAGVAKRSDAISRPMTRDKAVPTEIPTKVVPSEEPTTSEITREGEAPSAMRMPMSCVRCATV